MTFSVTKSTSNADLAGLDNGAAVSRGTGKEIGLNGLVQDADAPAEGAFAQLFSALAGAFGSETEANPGTAERVAEGAEDSTEDSAAGDTAGKTELNSENNDELLSRLAQSSQFLRAENQTPNSDLTSTPAVELKPGGNMLPNTEPFAPQIMGSAIADSTIAGSTIAGSNMTDSGIAEGEQTAGKSDGGELTDSESADAGAVMATSSWLNSIDSAGAGVANDKKAAPVAELSATDKQGQLGQILSPQSEREPRLAAHTGIAAELSVAVESEASDTELNSTEPSDAAAIIAAAGQPVSGQLAADNTARTERQTDAAEEKSGVNADPVSLAQSGPAKTRQSQAADTLLNAAVNSAQPDTEQSELQDGTTLTDVQDFSAVLDHARGHEQTDPLSRTAKAPNLTAAEQQVLDKRVNLHDSRASSELNEKIAVMVNKDVQSATIRLDPAELGSMQIKLVIQNDQANVVIHTQNHQSRDLLDQSMPRLREMLQQQGIALGDSQVQADSGRQQQSNHPQPSYATEQKNSNNTSNAVFDSHSESPVTTQYWQDSAKGVDFYA